MTTMWSRVSPPPEPNVRDSEIDIRGQATVQSHLPLAISLACRAIPEVEKAELHGPAKLEHPVLCEEEEGDVSLNDSASGHASTRRRQGHTLLTIHPNVHSTTVAPIPREVRGAGFIPVIVARR
jgi:hypothetical protein